MKSLWRDPNFLKLWIGQTISEIGSRITREGLPLTAVMVLGTTPAQMGLLQAAGGLAALFAGPISGLLADRFRRKPIMIAADLGRAALLALIPVSAAEGWLSLPLLFTIVAITGVLTVLFDVAYQTIVPSLMERGRLLEANSRLALSASTAEMVGPALTGLLVQLLTAPRAILLDSVSFLLSAASLVSMHVDEQPAERSKHSAAKDILDGFRYVAQHELLRPLAIRAAVVFFSYGAFGLYVLYAIQDLRIQPAVLGFIIALGGLSSFFGAALAERVGRRFRTGHILIAANLLSGVAALIIPLGTGPLYGALALALAQIIGDISFPMFSIHELTLRQTISDEKMIGRVNAAMNMLFKGLWPLGALAAGYLATAIGIRATFALASAGVLSGGVILFFSAVRGYRR